MGPQQHGSTELAHGCLMRCTARPFPTHSRTCTKKSASAHLLQPAQHARLPLPPAFNRLLSVRRPPTL
eukprot:363826-Chlamydomonas_euryale.AAC.1